MHRVHRRLRGLGAARQHHRHHLRRPRWAHGRAVGDDDLGAGQLHRVPPGRAAVRHVWAQVDGPGHHSPVARGLHRRGDSDAFRGHRGRQPVQRTGVGRPAFVWHCARGARAQPAPRAHRHARVPLEPAVCRVWRVDCALVCGADERGVAVELHPRGHLLGARGLAVPLLLPPAHVCPAPRAGQDKMADGPGDRLCRHCLLHGRVCSLPHRAVVGWDDISLGECAYAVHVARRPRHLGGVCGLWRVFPFDLVAHPCDDGPQRTWADTKEKKRASSAKCRL